MKRSTILPLFLLLAGCGGDKPAAGAGAAPKLAFVTNCVAGFWTVAQAGVEAAKASTGAEVSVQMPADGLAEQQTRILEDALAKGVHGIAVSPKDPANMTELLDKIAGRAVLITHDSDAPKSKRLCYIGVDNYEAGRMCGQLVKDALPSGGAVVIIVGTLDQDNARLRRQGLIDELLDRSLDNTRFDPQDAVLKGAKYEVRATYTDQFNHAGCKNIAQDVLGRWNDVGCLVGLFEYEPPLLLEAVEEARKVGQVKLVAFDEAEQTLRGVVAGKIHGTIVQNPYEYGRQSIELLARLVREQDPARRQALLPPGGILYIPARKLQKDNVQAFWDDLKQKTGKK
ncbi:MAG: substrate-binding domain-containing protein [Planctomycetes bacterium]|nr:substrate-binding domain-containing protein [Planctomycetota bacterium]